MNGEILYNKVNLLDRKYYFYYFLMFSSVLTFIFFKSFFIILLLLMVNGLLSLLLRPIKSVPHGIELVMFNTVLTSYVYGSNIGAIVGVISIISSYIIMGRVSLYILTLVPVYALVGYLAYFFNSYPISYVGLGFTIFYSVISSVVVMILFNAKIYKSLFFIITNFIFNYFIFFSVAPVVLRLV